MAKQSQSVSRPLFSSELMPGALSAELIGTFILTSAVLATSGNVIVAAVAVLAIALVFGKISGGHINPAVTIALFATKQISVWKAFGYVAAQLLGAMLALIVATKFMAGNAEAAAAGAAVFKIPAITGTWVPMLAEALGAVVLGLGVGAAVLGKREGFDAAFSIGGAILVGLVIATFGSSAILNPAVALGLGAYTANWWSVWAYALGPIVGVVVGVWLFKLMLWDTTNGKKAK